MPDLQNIELTSQHKFISILNMSLCYSNIDIIELCYCIVPSIILQNVQADTFVLEHFKRSPNKKNLIKMFELSLKIFNQSENLKLKYSKKLWSLAICLSNEDPCYQFPILNILDDFLKKYSPSSFIDSLVEEHENKLLQRIREIKKYFNDKQHHDKKEEIDYIYTEICALLMIYTLLFYDDPECKKAFDELSVGFMPTDNVEYFKKLTNYFNLWLEKHYPPYPNYNPNSKDYYIAFYKSLFSIYKLDTKQIKPENISINSQAAT